MAEGIKDKVMSGYLITKSEAVSLAECNSNSLASGAREIKEHFCGNSFDLCTIVNGKSGLCSENCKYCAQSVHYRGKTEEYPLLGSEEILKEALYSDANGIGRFSVVTSGRALSEPDLENLCKSYKILREKTGLSLCASCGLLKYDDFVKLKESGVSRYHNNLETSRRYFSEVCTTHTYDEKIAAVKDAQRAGLTVCSGGIMGLGETMEDRIDMALELRSLGIKSVPINFLTPIPGTPLEKMPHISEEEAMVIVSLYRFILPDSFIRLAGGRSLMKDRGKALMASGANAAITGDMLTTAGISISDDIDMISELGYEVRL